MVLLAVYGTLKQGHYNHRVHLDRRPIFNDFVTLEGMLYTNGRYPMLVKTDQPHSIYIEIYDISKDTLVAIDQLEEPFGYHREQIDIDGVGRVWIYYYTSGNPPDGFYKIETGNFEKEMEW